MRLGALMQAAFAAVMMTGCASPLLWGPSEAEIQEYQRGPRLSFGPPLLSATGRFAVVRVQGAPGGPINFLYDIMNDVIETVDYEHKWGVPRAFTSTRDRIAFVLYSDAPDKRGKFSEELWEYDIESKEIMLRAKLPSPLGPAETLAYGPGDEIIVLPCAYGDSDILRGICNLSLFDGGQALLLPTNDEGGDYKDSSVRGFASRDVIVFDAPQNSGHYAGFSPYERRCFRLHDGRAFRLHHASFYSCSQSTNGRIVGVMMPGVRGRQDVYEWIGPDEFELIADLPLDLVHPVISADGRYVAVLARHSALRRLHMVWDLFVIDLETKKKTRTNFRQRVLEFLNDTMDLRELKHVH